MHILFIGGTGNISTDCAALLHKRGHQITILSRGKNPIPAEYGSIVADRTNSDEMCAALAGREFGVAINFTGFTPSELKIDAKALGDRIQQYIFISSATVYAKPHPIPVTESAALGNDWSDYAQNKQLCEEWLWRHAEEFPCTIVRPSHTYSFSWVPNVIASGDFTFADRLLKGKPVFVPDDGQTLWTLTTTRDFAVGLAGLVGNKDAIGEAFHITSDEVLTWRQIYQEVAKALGAENIEIEAIPTEFICNHEPEMIGKLKGDKAHHAVFDNAKIKRFVPDFQCKDSFRTGIVEAVRWYAENPEKKTVNEATDQLWDDIIEAWRNR